MAPRITLFEGLEGNQYHKSKVHVKTSRKSTRIKHMPSSVLLKTFLNFRVFPSLKIGPVSRTKGCELRALSFQLQGAMLVLESPWFRSQQPHGRPAAVRARDASIEWDGTARSRFGGRSGFRDRLCYLKPSGVS